MTKVAITVAPLAQAYYDDVDSFPAPERLAQEISECCQAGASVVHLHVIDEQESSLLASQISDIFNQAASGSASETIKYA
jgi:uncharacterized protein (DUF849 family)